MADPTQAPFGPQDALKDPDFHKMPLAERQKVMRTLDPEYGGLPAGEQLKVLNQAADFFSKPGGKIQTSASTDRGNFRPPTTRQMFDTGIDSLPFIGSQAGALIGGAMGNVPGAMAGSGLGGAAGRGVQEILRPSGKSGGQIARDIGVEGVMDTATEGLGAVLNAPLKWVMGKAPRLVESAIMPRTSLPMRTREQVVGKMLNTDIPVKGAYQGIRARVAKNTLATKKVLRAGGKAGETISPWDATRDAIRDVRKQFQTQATPKADLKVVSRMEKEFADKYGPKAAVTGTPATYKPNGATLQVTPGTAGSPAVPAKEVTPLRAWKLKSGTSKQLNDAAFDGLTSAAKETQKAYIKGVGDEIINKFPQLGPVFKDSHEMLELLNVMQTEVARSGNRRIMGLKATMMASNMPEGDWKRLIADGALLLLDNPRFKVALARAINRANKLTAAVPAVGKVAGRIIPAATTAALGGADGVLAPNPRQ